MHRTDTDESWTLFILRSNAAPVDCIVGGCRHPRALWFALFRVAENLWKMTDYYFCEAHIPNMLRSR